jgi:hypothetical protein
LRIAAALAPMRTAQSGACVQIEKSIDFILLIEA